MTQYTLYKIIVPQKAHYTKLICNKSLLYKLYYCKTHSVQNYNIIKHTLHKSGK